MKLPLLILVTATLLMKNAAGYAQDINLFIPGDAFFHTEISKHFCENIDHNKEISFRYIPPKREERIDVVVPYTHGIKTLNASKLPKAQIAALTEVYLEIRKYEMTIYQEYINHKGDLKREELNPAHLFIHNANFPFREHNPFLKYNELWGKELAALGSNRKRVGNKEFVQDKGLVSWRDADLVAGLKIQQSETERTDPLIQRKSKYELTIINEVDLFVIDSSGTINEYLLTGKNKWTLLDDVKAELLE